ncbi:MAG: GNAT family N-acetyltransferase [Pseudomonadota bacterium]
MRESLERIGRFDPARARTRFEEGFDPAHMRIVRIGETRVGCVTVRPGGPSELWVEHLYVEPAHQGRGLGGLILGEIIHQAHRERATLRLGVLKESDANRFYVRHGFRETHRETWDIYYERPPAGG